MTDDRHPTAERALLTWDENQAGRAALAELVARRQVSNAREQVDLNALESASWRDSAARDIDGDRTTDS